jgi:hypothetical protein
MHSSSFFFSKFLFTDAFFLQARRCSMAAYLFPHPRYFPLLLLCIASIQHLCTYNMFTSKVNAHSIAHNCGLMASCQSAPEIDGEVACGLPMKLFSSVIAAVSCEIMCSNFHTNIEPVGARANSVLVPCMMCMDVV